MKCAEGKARSGKWHFVRSCSHRVFIVALFPGNMTPRTAMVRFSYKAVRDDELDLDVDDVIDVLEEAETGWMKGKLRNTGRVGLFPTNFVQFLGMHIFIFLCHAFFTLVVEQDMSYFCSLDLDRVLVQPTTFSSKWSGFLRWSLVFEGIIERSANMNAKNTCSTNKAGNPWWGPEFRFFFDILVCIKLIFYYAYKFIVDPNLRKAQ